MNCISNRFNLAQNPPLPPEMTYNKLMDQTALPVYSSLEALLAAEAPSLRDRCLALAEGLANEVNGDLDRVDDADLELALEGLTEANLVEKAEALADLADWFN